VPAPQRGPTATVLFRQMRRLTVVLPELPRGIMVVVGKISAAVPAPSCGSKSAAVRWTPQVRAPRG